MKKWGFILGMSVLLLAAFPFLGYVSAVSEDGVYFSCRQHFYDHAIKVTMAGASGCSIYYTTDGEEPSASSTLYTGPLSIDLPEEGGLTVLTVRAIAVYSDGTTSSECVHTYFVGEDVFTRYDSLVTVVTIDPDYLYDYDTGIFVAGRLRDEWLAENPDKSVKHSRPANYNLRGIESERPAYLEIFTPSGEQILSQHVGIRVNGGLSRSSDYKSLKIFARSEYGVNKLSYEFFPDSLTYTGNQATTEYKRLVLRNNSGIETVAMMELLKDVEQLDVQEYRHASGYLNGTYYHCGWIMEDYDETYFHTNYGTTEMGGAWETIAGYSENVLDGKTTEEVFSSQTEAMAAESKAYYNQFADRDFQDELVFQEFCDLVDVENMLWYFAAEIYMGNLDWPYNNIKLYRWYSYDDAYEENTRTDGKWRFLLYDLDYGFAADYEENLLAHVLNTENTQGRHHKIFYNLMKREDMRTRFQEIVLELSETAFEPEHASQVINELFEISETELLSAIQEATKAKMDASEFEERLQNLRTTKESMLEFAQERPAEIQRQMEELLK